MFVDPVAAIPRKVFMTPITVPSSPSRGEMDPTMESQGSPWERESRSSDSPFSSTILNASSWVRESPGPTGAPSRRDPGRSSEKKFTPWRKTRL
jgi:hypothetical protein